MEYKWNEEKNKKLKSERGFNFDDLLPFLENGEILEITKHSNAVKYPHQYVLFIRFNGYVCEVPFIFKDSNTLFLKTIYQSRKANRRFKQ